MILTVQSSRWVINQITKYNFWVVETGLLISIHFTVYWWLLIGQLWPMAHATTKSRLGTSTYIRGSCVLLTLKSCTVGAWDISRQFNFSRIRFKRQRKTNVAETTMVLPYSCKPIVHVILRTQFIDNTNTSSLRGSYKPSRWSYFVNEIC